MFNEMFYRFLSRNGFDVNRMKEDNFGVEEFLDSSSLFMKLSKVKIRSIKDKTEKLNAIKSLDRDYQIISIVKTAYEFNKIAQKEQTNLEDVISSAKDFGVKRSIIHKICSLFCVISSLSIGISALYIKTQLNSIPPFTSFILIFFLLLLTFIYIRNKKQNKIICDGLDVISLIEKEFLF